MLEKQSEVNQSTPRLQITDMSNFSLKGECYRLPLEF